MEADQIGDEDMIPEEEMIISITRNGYIKRVSAETYRVQKRGGRGVIGVTSREADEIAHLFHRDHAPPHLLLHRRGRVYRVKAYEVPQTSRTAMGAAIINFIGIEPGDRITANIPIASLDQEGYLVMATERGEVKADGPGGLQEPPRERAQRLRPGAGRLAAVGPPDHGRR
jgi:DNA gyrase subunit A